MPDRDHSHGYDQIEMQRCACDDEVVSRRDRSEEPAAFFSTLAELIYARAAYAEIQQAIINAAPALVVGCDHASLMVRRHARFETAASSDEVAAHADRVERELGDGPCVDAIMDDSYQLDADIAADSPWPRRAERLLAETPVRGMAAHRILIDGDKVGALNMFSDTPGAMDEASADQGVVLASFASVALSAAARHERAESLQRGLASNREIGKAVGLLMAAHKVGSDEAFELLRRASSEMNIKLAEVAREVVQYHDSRDR